MADNNYADIRDKLKANDFALWETILYLDVYPKDKAALEHYYKLREQGERLTEEYEEKYGPLSSFTNQGESWDWVTGPWPWESGAN